MNRPTLAALKARFFGDLLAVFGLLFFIALNSPFHAMEEGEEACFRPLWLLHHGPNLGFRLVRSFFPAAVSALDV